MPASAAYTLALGLLLPTAACAKVCFSLMADAEKRQSEAKVDETER